MKRSVLTLLALFLLPTLSRAELRQFTNQEGKTIQAEVVSVRNGQVYLKMSGRSFTVPFSSLSIDDQTFLREWVKINAPFSLSIQATTTDGENSTEAIPAAALGNTSSRDIERAGGTKSSEYQKFIVAIHNRSAYPLVGAKTQVRLFARVHYTVEREEGDEYKKDSGEMFECEFEIPEIGPNETIEISTPSVEMANYSWGKSSLQSRTENGRTYTYHVGESHQEERSLDSLWMKIFIEDRLIKEWKTTGRVIDKVNWDGHPKGTFELTVVKQRTNPVPERRGFPGRPPVMERPIRPGSPDRPTPPSFEEGETTIIMVGDVRMRMKGKIEIAEWQQAELDRLGHLVNDATTREEKAVFLKEAAALFREDDSGLTTPSNP